MPSRSVIQEGWSDGGGALSTTGTVRRSKAAGTSWAGKVIRGRYRVVDTLGVGSLGAVYLCDDLLTTTRVAFKVFRREFSRDEEFMRRLRRQVKLAARIGEKHPGLLAVYECEADHEGAFLTTEYLQGRTLKDVIRQGGPLDVQRALRLACQIADGLDAIHNMGFVHADVRPGNVIVVPAGGEEFIKLKGLEVAGLRETALVDHLIRAGVIPSHAEYVAPEQVDGDQVTLRTDIYAFGVVLYEMLTGRVPFSASSSDSVMAKHLQDAPEPLSAVRRELPSVLELRVKQALEKEPDRRQRYVGDVANEYLCELVTDELTEARRQGRGIIGKTVHALRPSLPMRDRVPGERPSSGVAWKVGGIAVLAAAAFLVAVWFFPSVQIPLRTYVSSFQQRWGVPPALMREGSVRSGESVSGPVPSSVPPAAPLEAAPRVDVPATPVREPDVEPDLEKIAEPSRPDRAEVAPIPPREVITPPTPPPPQESTLRPPRAQKSQPPSLERKAPPRIIERSAPADPVARPLSPPPQEERPPRRETHDPTAIIDWLLGQPAIKE